ncbi:hypothetical protein TWF718_002994 [Orbilia javanica]|uniref:Uncharacterized protein n=1 Tax=Orbilia javanica TaxID=47235 RepID=A0AAN8MPQ0_9PEZI
MPAAEGSQTPNMMNSGNGEPQSTPPMPSGSGSEPSPRSDQAECGTSSPAFIDVSPVGSQYSIGSEVPPRGLRLLEKLKWAQGAPPVEKEKKTENPPNPPAPTSPVSTIPSPVNSDYSVDFQAVPRGLNLRDRLQWAKANPSNAERKKRKRSSSPVAPRPPPPQPCPDPRRYDQDEVPYERPSLPESPPQMNFSEAMYAPLRGGQNTGTDSGRTTPHMLRIPPEEPPNVHPDDEDVSSVRKGQHYSPQWTKSESPKEKPISPPPFTIYVDDLTPTSSKRKRQLVEEIVEDGEERPSLESPAAEEVGEAQGRPGYSLPVILHTEDPSPRPRKKRYLSPTSFSDCSSPPTPVFHPSPARGESEEEKKLEVEGKKGDPAIMQLGTHREGGRAAERSLAIVQSNPHPCRPRTYGEIRSRNSGIMQSRSHIGVLKRTGSVPDNPAIALSDARPQLERITGEKKSERIRATPPPVIEDSPCSSLAPARGRSPCPTPRPMPWPKRHILDLSPYLTADRNTDESIRRQRLGTSFGRRLLGAKMKQMGQLKDGSESSSTEGERKPSSILKLFEFPELFARISNKLSEKDCLNLTSTCKALREKKGQVWDINAHMAHFLKRPTEFRSLMAMHGAVVSGSDALQFLSRERFANSDLDVYVEVGGLRGFKKHLEEVEGYNWVPYDWQSDEIEEAIVDRILDTKDYQKLEKSSRLSEESKLGYLARYEMKTLEGVFLFQKGKAGDQSLRQVQLIVTQGPPMYAILSDFYATHLFNVYDYKCAYSLFPQGTFVERKAYKTQAMTAKVVRCCSKYEQRGYGIQDYTDWKGKSTAEGKVGDVVFEVRDHREIRSSRRVGDGFSWCLDLDTTGVDVPGHPPSSLLEYTTFGMGGTDKRRNMYGEVKESVTPYVKVKCAPIKSEYVGADLVVDTLGGEWEEFLSETLRMVMRRGTQAGYRADIPLWYDMFQARRKEVEGLRGRLGRVKEKVWGILRGWGL